MVELLRGPVVTRLLIAVCAVVFVVGPASGLNPSYGTGDALFAAGTAYYRRWGVVPDELFTGSTRAALTPFTALFVHGGWLHLLGNCLFLHVFGRLPEERLGRCAFLVFFVLTGALSLVVYAAAHASSDQTLVGASGAISAVLGAFLYLFPKARITTVLPFLLFLPLRFPAWLVLLCWFGLQGWAAHRAGAGPGVAYLAHVAGFSLGFAWAWVRRGRGVRVAGPVPVPAVEGEQQP
ncbi:rhomboid family intramembrane serine protease [Streptomyces sp. BI20]|uniref:rhomboid family intramembrane serine protease n=1 Tax=Streptomyces sp. BI20 TaxID=3403460 RepID=UPI003C745C12